MRTYPKNRMERGIQIMRWLMEAFEVAEPGALRLEFKENVEPCKKTGKDLVYGQVIERRGKLVMQISMRTCRTTAQVIETIIHEAAHVRLWDTGRGLLHGKEFWVTFGEMMDAYDHHGWQDSKSYFVD